MLTVVLYCNVLIISTLFVWFGEKSRYHLSRILFIGCAFLLVFIPSAIRFDVGTDYISYINIFQDSDTLERYRYSEPIFYFINWFFREGGFDAQWAIAAFSFLFAVLPFLAYPRKDAWLWHFLLISLLWFFSFNGVRQAVSIVWCLLALVAFFDRRYLWFLFLSVVGASFHQSALFITLVGFLALIPLNDYFKTRIAPLIFVGLILFTYLFGSVVMVYIEYLLGLIGFGKYADYYHNAKHFVAREHGTGLGILAKVLFSVYIILNTKNIIRLNKNYWVVIIIALGYAIGNVLVNEIIIFGRMADTFVLGPIIGGAVLFQVARHRLQHQIALSLFLLFLFLAFLKNGFSVESPKLNPYQTVFMN